MSRTEVSKKLIKGSTGTRRRPIRLLAMLGLVAVIAASCGSEATTAAAVEQTNVTTPAAEVEGVTTTTAEPEAEPDIESEPNPAPDTAVAVFTAAFGIGDADEAWSFVSGRCRSGVSETPAPYSDFVAGYALDVPGATALNISADVFGDVAAISYDVHDDSGEFFESYTDQPWVFYDGKWFQDHC